MCVCVCVCVAFRTTNTPKTVQQICSGGQSTQTSRRYGSKWHNWHHALLADDLMEIWQQVDGSSAPHGLQRACQKAVARDYDVTSSLFEVYKLLLSVYWRIKTFKRSSSSIGTTAHCGLWPVEQCPSIFSYLPPTLSIFSPPALEDLFLLLLPILSWVFPFFSSLPVLEWRSFWASYPPPFSLGDLTSLYFALLSILLYFLLSKRSRQLNTQNTTQPCVFLHWKFANENEERRWL